ncbi:MAG: hypothetical protein R3D78_09275 [Paracoccaceae bacterium]
MRLTLSKLPTLLLPCAVVLGLAAPAMADPALGVGFNFAFGGGSPGGLGFGARLFSDDEEDEFAGSVGLDYMFGSGQVRPSVGVAYMGNNNYLGLDVGFGGGGVNFGMGGGYANTKSPASSPSVEPPPDEG